MLVAGRVRRIATRLDLVERSLLLSSVNLASALDLVTGGSVTSWMTARITVGVPDIVDVVSKIVVVRMGCKKGLLMTSRYSGLVAGMSTFEEVEHKAGVRIGVIIDVFCKGRQAGRDWVNGGIGSCTAAAVNGWVLLIVHNITERSKGVVNGSHGDFDVQRYHHTLAARSVFW